MNRSVLDDGFVLLVDTMGTDASIAKTARVTHRNNEKDTTPEKDKQLIKYLIKNEHTSPIEFGVMQFHVRAPIFVARQWFRHRMASYSEWSGRFTKLDTEFYYPESDRIKGKGIINKQGSEGDIIDTDKEKFISVLDEIYKSTEEHYSEFNSMGISNELARIPLPLATYTEFYWKIDLHNLLHFLKLRMDPHAQFEIREYANAISEMVKVKFPMIWDAFDEYILNSCRFSKNEMILLRNMLNRTNDRWVMSEKELEIFYHEKLKIGV